MIKVKENTKFLFAGDSITDGGRSRNMDLNHNLGHGYQYIIAAKIAADNIVQQPKFINKGFSGGSGVCRCKIYKCDGRHRYIKRRSYGGYY